MGSTTFSLDTMYESGTKGHFFPSTWGFIWWKEGGNENKVMHHFLLLAYG